MGRRFQEVRLRRGCERLCQLHTLSPQRRAARRQGRAEGQLLTALAWSFRPARSIIDGAAARAATVGARTTGAW